MDDEEHLGEAVPVDGLGQHREDGSVSVGDPSPLRSPLEDQDLVPQGEDLSVSAITHHDQHPDTGDEQPEKAGERSKARPVTVPDRRRPRTRAERLLGTLKPLATT